jgi:hypothetical protein
MLILFGAIRVYGKDKFIHDIYCTNFCMVDELLVNFELKFLAIYLFVQTLIWLQMLYLKHLVPIFYC